MSGKRKIDELHEIRIEDLLGREPVPPIAPSINLLTKGSTDSVISYAEEFITFIDNMDEAVERAELLSNISLAESEVEVIYIWAEWFWDFLIKDEAEDKLNIVKSNSPLAFKVPVFAHSVIGDNGNPEQKEQT